jgi:hypothetical protein
LNVHCSDDVTKTLQPAARRRRAARRGSSQRLRAAGNQKSGAAEFFGGEGRCIRAERERDASARPRAEATAATQMTAKPGPPRVPQCGGALRPRRVPAAAAAEVAAAAASELVGPGLALRLEVAGLRARVGTGPGPSAAAAAAGRVTLWILLYDGRNRAARRYSL